MVTPSVRFPAVVFRIFFIIILRVGVFRFIIIRVQSAFSTHRNLNWSHLQIVQGCERKVHDKRHYSGLFSCMHGSNISTLKTLAYSYLIAVKGCQMLFCAGYCDLIIPCRILWYHLFIFRAKIQVIILLPLMFRLILNSTHFGKHYVTGSQKSQGILNKHCLRMHEFVAFKHALWQCLSRANNSRLEEAE